MSTRTSAYPRREFLAECWTHAKRNRVVFVVTAAFTAYGLFTAIQPFIDFKPPPSISVPKLPLPWVIIIVLVGIIYILIEGGYRLRQAERAKYEAELAKYVDKPAFSVERHAERHPYLCKAPEGRTADGCKAHVLQEKSTAGNG